MRVPPAIRRASTRQLRQEIDRLAKENTALKAHVSGAERHIQHLEEQLDKLRHLKLIEGVG